MKLPRSKRLRILSEKLKRSYYTKYIGSQQTALFERENKNGYLYGFTENYIKVKIPFSQGNIERKQKITLLSFDENSNINAKI